MPTDTARSKTLGIRVTPEERRKIKKLAAARGRPYSDLLRESGVEELVAEYERSVQVLGGNSSDAS